MSKQVRILSIDGGGIRGIIPAMILSRLEERTGKRIAQMFDLIAGTSTGGILALALVKPNLQGQPEFPAERLVQLYEEKGKQIFSSSLWHKFQALGNLAEEKYPTEGIESVLGEYCGQARLSDALTNVLITAYEIEQRFPFLFKSHKAKVNPDYDFYMRDAARATSAAPTYFEPIRITTKDPIEYFALVDGGVYANNPAMCAYVEAKTLFPQAEDVLVVSLGTGQLTRSLPYDRVKGWGLASWAKPILDVVFEGVSGTVDYELKQLLPPRDGVKRYYRFQVRLEEGSEDLDNATLENIRKLKLLTEAMLREKAEDLNALCKQL